MTTWDAMAEGSNGINHRAKRGAVLIIVLWSVAVMSVVVVALSTFARKSTIDAGVDADLMRTEFALHAGIEVGKALIVTTSLEQRVFFDGTAFKVDIGGDRQAEISIMDAAGLVDVNQANTTFIENVAVAAGLTANQARSLVEHIGSLRKNKTPASENADQQKQSGSESEAKISPVFFSATQLRQLTDASAAAMDQFLPLVGVYGPAGKVNPLAAPSTILAAVPGVTPDDLQAFSKARQTTRWQNDQAIAEALVRLKDHIAITVPNSFVIKVVLLPADGILAGRRVTAVVVLRNGGTAAFQTLALSW